jgi:hypothetical protein
MDYQIVDIKELAKILCASTHTLKKNWRSFPHFFIGEGRNLKGARFNAPDVIEYLKKGGNYDNLERSEKKSLGVEIPVSKEAIQKGRISNQVRCIRVGSRETKRAKKSSSAGTDPFNLLSGIDKVS